MNLFTTKNSLKKYLPFLAALAFALSCNNDVKEISLRITSRMYRDFQEDHTVKMYQKFPIGDSDLEGVVVEFLPDFTIDTLTHKAVTMSDTLYNPAVKVLIINKGKEKKEEIWAFRQGMLPHFSPRSYLSFEILDFKTTGKYIEPDVDKANTGMENE